MKLISKSAYAIALSIPFIGLFEESKASKIFSGEKQLFIENKQTKDLTFI